MDGVRVKKAVIFSVGTCYRSVCKHPFFVGMVIFLFFMHRSFPVMFSFLVSASPVLVSTAVLLGTLLSFGQPNIPEIEKEEISQEIVSLRTGGGLDRTVVERDGSYRVERYSESRDMDKSVEEVSSTANDFSDVGKNEGLAKSAQLIEENSREFQFEKWETHGESDSCDVVFGHNNEVREGDGEVPVNVYTPVQRTVDEFENAKLFEAYVGAETVDGMSPQGSPRKHEDEEHEEDDDDDDESDSESDGAESSSPDASMADIIPLLDELHPLLDENVPQRARMSLEGSDSTSESSSESSSGEDNELDDDIENHEDDLEVVDDEEEQEGHANNIDEDKSAIKWTEVDQKNLMDLGTSELERNKRLESLIARRRLRKSMKMMAERNLIDFDSADLPFSIAHISTARRNPFDLPYDDDMGLPPIPGSAPSIMSKRRNPFDLPYDSSEEKPDLMGDDFQQDVMTLQSKEPIFRRNDTFSVGPSLFGTSRHESKFRPYFIPERMTSEGTSYASFHRQSSDLSESKASSVPETESITSDEDLEDKKPIEEDLEDKKPIEEDLEHEMPIEKDLGHEKPIEEDLVNEIELISIGEPELSSIPKHPSEHVGHGSDSSENEDSVDLDQEKRDDVMDEYEVQLLDVEDHQDMTSSFSATTAAPSSIKSTTNEVLLNTEAVELKSRSSSSVSDVNGEVYAGNEDELLSISEPLRGNSNEDFTILHQPSVEKADTGITRNLVDDAQHKEPVYDSTPRALDKKASSSSVDANLHVEKAVTSSPPSLVPRMIAFTQKDYEVNNQDNVDTPVDEVDEELVVTQHQPLSEEHMSQSEKGLPLTDRSVNEPSPRNTEELQESTNLINMDFQELDIIHQIDPPKTFEPSSVLPEAIGIEAPGADLDDDILDRVGCDETNHVLEHSIFRIEADATTGNMEDSVEDLDYIEEIDEGLLHELDTVGDFSIEDFGSNLHDPREESFQMMHNIRNSSEDLKNNDDYSGVTLGDEQNFRASGIEEAPSNYEEMEEASAFQISETSLGERLDLYNRKNFQVEAVDLLDSEKTNDRPLPKEIATEQNQNAKEINSGFRVVEVQSIHDNEFSYKEAEPMLEEVYVGFGEPMILHQDSLHVKTEVGMPVLEAHSIDDIRSALGQVDANVSEKQYAVDLLDSETATELADSYVMQNPNAGGINSGIPGVEVQEIHDNEYSYKAAEPMSEKMYVGFGESEVGMPVLEAHSLDDIRSSLGQLDANVSQKDAVDLSNSEKSIDKPLPEETATELANSNIMQSLNAGRINSSNWGVEVQEIHDNEFSYKAARPMSEDMYVGFGESDMLPQDLLHVESEVGMPVLESHSLDDIRLASGQADAKASEEQYTVDLVHTELSPCRTLDGHTHHEVVQEGSVPPESKFNLTLPESNLLNNEKSALELQQDPLHAETELVLPVLEPRSLDDIESDIDQVDGTDNEKRHALSLVNAKLSPDIPVGEYSQPELLHEGLVPPHESKPDNTVTESELVQDDQSTVAQHHGEPVDRLIPRGSDGDKLDSAESHDPVETLFSAHVDEARSNDDTDAMRVHVSPASVEKLPIADSEIESADLTVNELDFSKALESSSEVSGVVETSSETAEKLPEEVELTKDSKESAVEHKKTKSRKSSSTSSSSSSSSSSNSDEE